MIEIPNDVEQWTYGKIIDLVNEGYDENDILEIKREINTTSDRFGQTVCAFANTGGGTILFGIDNDRKKPLHVNDRIIGLDDTDQLKRNIIDKIKNIQPSIPIKNLIFRKSNIKLPNKKVIVILKIAPSNIRPHQYNRIFYKRLSDGNEPMDVTEIKQLILESQKNKSFLLLLRQECGFIRDEFEKAKDHLKKNELHLAVVELRNIQFGSIKHFMFNQSFLYSNETTQTLMRILESIAKLSSFPEMHEKLLKFPSKKSESFKKQMYFGLDILINDGLEHFLELEKHLDIQFITPIIKEDYIAKLDAIRNEKDSVDSQIKE